MRSLLDRETVPIDAFKDVDTVTTAPVNNDVLTFSSANGTWQPAVAPGAGGGEANTGSNQGTDGEGVYDTKVGVDLQFRNIAPASSKVTVVLNSKDIDIDVVEANLSLTLSQISDITATAAEVNLLDLAGLTAGWVLSADTATTASWKAPTGGSGAFTLDAQENLFAGTGAGAALLGTADDNFLAGNLAGNSLTSGDDNILIGLSSGTALSTQFGNVFLGQNVGALITGGTSHYNVAIGYNALGDATTSIDNICIGREAGSAITSTTSNIAIGTEAMGNPVATWTGNNNVAIGVGAMNTATGNASTSNMAIGQGALESVNGATANIGIGQNALNTVTNGANNVSVGHNSGDKIAGGDDNVMIGVNAGPTTNGSDGLYINTTESDTPLIGGSFTNGNVTMRGTIRFTERANHILTPTATFGEIWLRNDAANVLVFTDDDGTDWDLNGAASGGVSSIDDLTDVDTTTDVPVLGDTLVFDGTNWVTSLTQLIKEVDDVGGTTIYIGEAAAGTTTATASWRVKRIVFTGDDSETLFADGDVNFDNTWDGRAGFSYS